MANFYTYTSDGLLTLSIICQMRNCNKSELLTLNSEPYSGDTSISVGQYLQQLDLEGQLIPKGLTFKIPVGLTGGVNSRYSSFTNNSTLLTTINGTDTKYNTTTTSVTHYQLRSSASNYSTSRDFNCYTYVLLDGSAQDVYDLPVYPNEFSDSNRPNFSPISILGRSVDYQVYQGSSRSVSFILNLHDELCPDRNYVHNLVAYIESAAYPGYTSDGVLVPEIFFQIGNQFTIRGILTGCDANWKAPIISGRLVNCDLSISITETSGPWSQYEIRNSGGFRTTGVR